MTSQDQLPTQPTSITPEEASTQLQAHLSSFFGFFTKVSKDISTSSSNLAKALPEKNPITLIEAKRKKPIVNQPASNVNIDTTPRKTTETPEQQQEPQLTQPEIPPQQEEKDVKTHVTSTSAQNIDEKPVKPSSQRSNKSNKSTRPALKEGIMHVEPPKEAVKTAPVVSYNSLSEMFGSIGKFFSQTQESIETGAANAYAKVQAGLDLNNKIKNGLRVPDKKALAAQAAAAEKAKAEEIAAAEKARAAEVAAAQAAEARKAAINSAAMRRLEEAKKMKENFEKQLKNLDQEIQLLERGEVVKDGEGSNRSSSQNQNKREKKTFRISSQKSSRESAEKAKINASQPNIPKAPKKMLVPMEDGKHAGKKWQENGEKEQKVMKSVASEPLYLRMEKEFMQNVIFPELEARKEKLKMKREFYKPMDDKELREHAIKYEERKKVMAPSEKEDHKAPALNFAKSQTYKKMLELEKEEKVKVDQKANEKKQLKDKAQQYAKLVKEMYFPKPDPKDDLLSKENLHDIILRSQKAELPMMTSTAKDTGNTSNMGAARIPMRKKRPSQDMIQQTITHYSPEKYAPAPVHTSYLKRKVMPKVHAVPSESDLGLKEHMFDLASNREETEGEEVPQTKLKKKSDKSKPRMVSVSPVKGEKKASEKGDDETTKKEMSEPEVVKKSYPNYLAEIRKKRMEQEKNGGKKYGQWEKILKKKDMTQQEKVNNIMNDINRLEYQAKMKEDKLRQHDLQKEYHPVDLEDEVGEMYLESIKAKLAIIKDLA